MSNFNKSTSSGDYKFLIWKEPIQDHNEIVKLHLVRRHKNNFRQLNKHFKNPNENWYYKDKVSISPNKDIKKIVINNFKGKDYKINDFNIIIKIELLDELYVLIDEYFSNIQ